MALVGLALAGLMWAIARGRRLGPAEVPGVEVSRPPRSAYVDALALLLRRSEDARGTAAALSTAAARELHRREPPGPAPSPRARAATMRRMGLSDAEISSVLDACGSSAGTADAAAAGANDSDRDALLAAGGALARLRAR